MCVIDTFVCESGNIYDKNVQPKIKHNSGSQEYTLNRTLNMIGIIDIIDITL